MSENITILKLSPHSSHFLQPMHFAVFKSLKTSWDAALVQWQRQYIGLKLLKREFSKMIGQLWLDMDSDNIIHGFKKGGICPFDDTILFAESFDPNALKRWQQYQKLVSAELQTQTSEIRTTNVQEIPSTSTQATANTIEDEVPTTLTSTQATTNIIED